MNRTDALRWWSFVMAVLNNAGDAVVEEHGPVEESMWFDLGALTFYYTRNTQFNAQIVSIVDQSAESFAAARIARIGRGAEVDIYGDDFDYIIEPEETFYDALENETLPEGQWF